MDIDAAFEWWGKGKYLGGMIVRADTEDTHVTVTGILNTLFHEFQNLRASLTSKDEEIERLKLELAAKFAPDWTNYEQGLVDGHAESSLSTAREEIERLQSYESAVRHDAQYQKGYDAGRQFERVLLAESDNFDAKRLRRLATICGMGLGNESDEFMTGCAGTILGTISRVVEGLFESRENDISTARQQGAEAMRERVASLTDSYAAGSAPGEFSEMIAQFAEYFAGQIRSLPTTPKETAAEEG